MYFPSVLSQKPGAASVLLSHEDDPKIGTHGPGEAGRRQREGACAVVTFPQRTGRSAQVK